MYDPIVVDSWQFITIEREVGLPFELMKIVQDTLLMHVSDRSPRSIAKRVIREFIPASAQEIYLEEIQMPRPRSQHSPRRASKARFSKHTPGHESHHPPHRRRHGALRHHHFGN